MYELQLKRTIRLIAHCFYNSIETYLVSPIAAPRQGNRIGSGAALRRSVTGASQSLAPLVASRNASPPAASDSALGPSSKRQPRTRHQDLLASCYG